MHIYIANLASITTAEELRQIFEPYGLMDTMQIIMDRDPGCCKGLWFIDRYAHHMCWWSSGEHIPAEAGMARLERPPRGIGSLRPPRRHHTRFPQG